jgi:Xaa-Pro aminopeptidase
MPKRELKENMVLCLECYAGKVGAPFGVKLEEQVLVTPDGPRSIGAYPYERKLLD